MSQNSSQVNSSQRKPQETQFKKCRELIKKIISNLEEQVTQHNVPYTIRAMLRIVAIFAEASSDRVILKQEGIKDLSRSQ